MTIASAAMLLALLQVAPSIVPAPPRAAVRAGSSIDWAALPPLPYRTAPQVLPQMTAFVAMETARANCPRPANVDGRVELRADVAVLIGAEGVVRATIPRAIGCPMVEQYAAGLVLSFARNNLNPRLVEEGGWYRASMTFDWPE